MGSETLELALDLKPYASRALDRLLSPAIDRRAARLEETLRDLEGERGKMEAFKRELPCSIRLIADVILILKEEMEKCRCGPVKEFMPVDRKFDEEEDGAVKAEKDCADKMSWMSSAQLWINHYSDEGGSGKGKMEEINNDLPVELESKSWNGGGGAFMRFKAPQELTAGCGKDENGGFAVPNSGGYCAVEERQCESLSSRARDPMASLIGSHLSLQAQHQQQLRKARRCWDQKLHHQFILALQQLGGPQVATPKQIRELMRVEGLTNDEVKSHLQKYRLHLRRATKNSVEVARPIAMVGGLWVSSNHYTSCGKHSSSQSGSPEGPLQLACSSSYNAVDSFEDDGKSECCNWN